MPSRKKHGASAKAQQTLRANSRGIKKIAVLYHGGDCPDGFGAAWAAWKKFGNRADYYPVTHNAPPPPLRGRIIYFLDIVYTGEALQKLKRDNIRVTAIDHHISTKEAVASTDDYRYAIDRSGAVLAWRYFHPGTRTPWALRYIEDMDIWNLALRNTREVRAMMKLLPFDLKAWDRFILKFEAAPFRKKTMEEGKLLRRYQEQAIARIIASSAERVRFRGHAVYAVNAPIWSDEIGHAIYEKHPPFAIIWRRRSDALIRVSLRGNGAVDLSKLAEEFGGGGHRDASGFTVPAANIPWKPA